MLNWNIQIEGQPEIYSLQPSENTSYKNYFSTQGLLGYNDFLTAYSQSDEQSLC